MSRARRYNRAPYQTMVTPSWIFLERFVPGAQEAWERDVQLPGEDFTIGVTGKVGSTLHAIAFSKEWSSLPPEQRKRFEYHPYDKTWKQTHP